MSNNQNTLGSITPVGIVPKTPVSAKPSFTQWQGVHISFNPSDFHLLPFNRDISEDVVKQLIDTITQTNIFVPISVVKKDGKLYVIDGQHRLETAKIGFPGYGIPYTLLDISAAQAANDEVLFHQILLVNKIKNGWKLEDVMESLAIRGDVLCKTALELKGYTYDSVNKEWFRETKKDRLRTLRLAHVLSILTESNFKETNLWFKELIGRKPNKAMITIKRSNEAKEVADYLSNIFDIVTSGKNSSHIANGFVRDCLSSKCIPIQTDFNKIALILKSTLKDGSNGVYQPSLTAGKQWQTFFEYARTGYKFDFIKGTVASNPIVIDTNN